METKGRSPLKLGAIFAIAVIALFGWLYYQSPDQAVARQMKQAAQARSAGQVARAAELFANVAVSGRGIASQGAEGLAGLLDAAVLQPLPPADTARVFAEAHRARMAGQPAKPAKQLAALGWSLIEALGPKDPSGAKVILDAIAPLELDKARLDAAAGPLLERIVAANPKDPVPAMAWAEWLDRHQDCARCEALLTPHAAALGRSESARILGQIHASKGRLDESYALLQPYTEEKLKVFVQREADYRKAYDDLEKAALETLRKGLGPADFYTRYKAADEEKQRSMVSEYLNEQVAKSSTIKAQLQALRDSAAIVPVALDLGIVTLQRAQAMSDADARNVQLKAAEKVFLAIQGLAGGTDAYRLNLGQIYYWLGKQAEGKTLFDEFLASKERSYDALINVGTMLRAVGSVHEARGLTEEAYRKAPGNDERWQAAHFRAVMFTDSEDQLAWLERSDRSLAHVRASIHSTRAHLALFKGQRAAAKRDFELAAAEYAKLPESAGQLNNSALIQLSLYGLDGDPKYSALGLAQLDQALTLMPTDSTLLLNNIAAVKSASVAAIIGDRINLPLLQTEGDWGMLEFLHTDEASRAVLRGTVRDNAAVKKALAYSDKAALLAPRHLESHAFPATLASLFEDAPSMEAAAARAKAAKVDLTDVQREQAKLADPAELQKQRDRLTAYNQQATALIQQPAVQKHPTTWAVALDRWCDTQVSMAQRGQRIDADAMVKLARKAYAATPSAGTRAMLLQALETRATQRLAKASPAFAAVLAKHSPVISWSTLLIVQFDEDPEFRRIALADPDMIESMAMFRDRDRHYPHRSSRWAWILARHQDAAYGQQMATRLRQDPVQAATFRIKDAFEPQSAENVIAQYHHALAGGKRDEAQQVLEAARKAQIPLPEALGRQLKV